MVPARPTSRLARCVLCISCANAVRPDGPEDGSRCLAGGDPERALFECESYVRRLGRAPDVPVRYRHPPG
jgi:hypothetical protein